MHTWFLMWITIKRLHTSINYWTLIPSTMPVTEHLYQSTMSQLWTYEKSVHFCSSPQNYKHYISAVLYNVNTSWTQHLHLVCLFVMLLKSIEIMKCCMTLRTRQRAIDCEFMTMFQTCVSRPLRKRGHKFSFWVLLQVFCLRQQHSRNMASCCSGMCAPFLGW